MRDEYGNDPATVETMEPDRIVTAVLAHPFHGRLVERVILYVQPKLRFKGENYKLTWWGDGIAYYRPAA
ncbi:MAG: hypothetical protein FJ128_04150 [Deltaproteobacteria bacterium]|nr:hypothetical protein [Deltaproteobacteria bacterium]